MSINQSSATALVRFTGLGIISFNQEQQRGEVAVIRDNKHTLSVKIQRPVFQDGADQDVVVYQDIATYQTLPKDDVSIDIKAIGNPAIEGYQIYRAGDFERLDSPDPNDFRWIVNMNTLHAGTPLVKSETDRDPLTRISVSNAGLPSTAPRIHRNRIRNSYWPHPPFPPRRGPWSVSRPPPE